jgi:hypothetical protein
MTVRFVRPVSHAAYLSRYLGFSALVIFLIAVPLHRFGPLTTPDFVALLILSAVIAAIAVLLALIGLQRLWTVGALGGVSSTKALFLSGLPLGVAIWAGVLYWQNPEIHDVSTDVTDVPAWLVAPTANQQWMPRLPTIGQADRAAQAEAYPGLTGHRYEGAIDRIYQAARKVARAQRITISKTEGLAAGDVDEQPPVPQQDAPADDFSADELPSNVPVPLARPGDAPPAVFFTGDGNVLLQGQTRTLVWGLRFDVLIRLREDTETTLVDVRVASRFGPHDLGMGAAIAEAYLDALDAEMLGLNDS